MKSDCFIDTNIWIYALLESEEDSGKRTTALEFLRKISPASRTIVSAQVINEFHWVLARKYAIPDEVIKDKVENGIAQYATIMSLNYAAYQNSFHLRSTYQLSFWDSLIVASALQHGCTILYTEDLSHNVMIEKTLRIANPFALSDSFIPERNGRPDVV